jgi:hypothetical protein
LGFENVTDALHDSMVGTVTFVGLSYKCIIRVIKSRSMRWAGHVARMGEMKNAYDILVGKPEGKTPF